MRRLVFTRNFVVRMAERSSSGVRCLWFINEIINLYKATKDLVDESQENTTAVYFWLGQAISFHNWLGQAISIDSLSSHHITLDEA